MVDFPDFLFGTLNARVQFFPSFLLSCSSWHLPNAFQCTERVVLNHPLEQARGTLLVNSGHVDCHVIDLPNPRDSALDRGAHRRHYRSAQYAGSSQNRAPTALSELTLKGEGVAGDPVDTFGAP